MKRRRNKKSLELHFAERVKSVRLEQGLSQAALARKSGLAQSAVARIEAQAINSSLQTVDKLALGLGVPVDALLSGTEATESGQPDRVFLRLCAKLRGRDRKSLQAIEALLEAFDRATR